MWYRSFDGRQIQSWILKPPDFDASRKYPLILEIHGGPHSAYGEGWFDEFQSLAGAGVFGWRTLAQTAPERQYIGGAWLSAVPQRFVDRGWVIQHGRDQQSNFGPLVLVKLVQQRIALFAYQLAGCKVATCLRVRKVWNAAAAKLDQAMADLLRLLAVGGQLLEIAYDRRMLELADWEIEQVSERVFIERAARVRQCSEWREPGQQCQLE